MHQAIFATSNGSATYTVTEFLHQEIESRFGVKDVPDAFFYLPEQLGGLCLRNPFISVSLHRKELTKSPAELVDEYSAKELTNYQHAKKNFEETTTRKIRQDILENLQPDRAFEKHDIISADEIDKFLSIDEWNKLREEVSLSYGYVCDELMDVPECTRPRLKFELKDAISEAKNEFNLGALDTETMWVIGLYAEDLLRDYGRLSLVDKQYLPMGVLYMIKGKKVIWQMVL